jgi:3-oxoadipate enol-lactonase
MTEFATIRDVVVAADATGRIRYDRRASGDGAAMPPLVLIGGMTQTVASWGGQLRPLSRKREVVAYETRGQGATELDLSDCSPQRHVEDFVALIEAVGLRTPVDVCGFSFGGRVATAVAATHPALVRRVVLTAVGLDRGIVGRLIVRGWVATLDTGDLEALARVTLPDILGGPYLEEHAELVESMVQTAVDRNRYDAIRALFEQTLSLPADSPWAIDQLIARIEAPTLVINGALDRLAPPAEGEALAQALGGQHRTIPAAGHTVPIEAPQAWRAAVEDFLA